MAAAIVVHQVAAEAYPAHFDKLPESSVRNTWRLGWPLPCAVRTTTGEVTRLGRLELAVNVLVAAVLVLGTAFTAGQWRDSRFSLPEGTGPVRLGQLVVILSLTALAWAALVALLRVPAAVFVGWLALGVAYLGVPCTAYSLAAGFGRPLRFSLLTLLAVVTVLCMLLAALNARN